MYKIIADTSTQDFFMAIIKDDKCLDYILIKGLVKKTDVLPVHFKNLLKKNNVDIKDIEQYYCTNGPGSFTGSRATFIFFKMLCMLNKKDLFLSSSLQFLAKANGKQKVVVDARSNMQYVGVFENKKPIDEIKLLINNEKISTFSIEDFLNNTSKYFSSFKKVSKLLDTKVNYIKEPAVGKKKARY